MFQFTHPGRGATGLGHIPPVLQGVSIHAPREGCDYIQITPSTHRICFNSRTPGGVRLQRLDILELPILFQFTHPGRGATEAISASLRRPIVSIHAPREGCDSGSRSPACDVACFNSRTPGGVRPLREVFSERRTGFQFTHPGRGATSSGR